ncbi:MAG: enoyl-CoA hydratase/isomerase family protein, partial [Planctomycetes bacterium]|nr:enoyl-CoA hydratase/isomerase family protein [Planctomycetota bacterium]
MSAWRLISSDDTPWTEPLWNGGGPIEVDGGSIRHLILDADHSANALSESVLEELAEVVATLKKELGVAALMVWSGKASHFVAGADIDEIDSIRFPETATEKAQRAQAIFDELSSLPMPTFAVIRGTCLGGGLELALALDYRIAVDAEVTKIGLPEVNLGIIPGFGGTQRLPRLIGLRGALQAILGASRLPARAAERRGIVDLRVPDDGYVRNALIAVKRVIASDRDIRKRRRKLRGGMLAWLLERNPLGRSVLRRRALAGVRKKTGGHYPAPVAAVESILASATLDLRDGLAFEAKQLGPLVASDVCRSLIAVFQASEEARKLHGFDDVEGEVPADAMIGVIGAGIMGAGIATQCLDRGFPVRLRDLQTSAIGRALETIGAHFAKRMKRRRMDRREVEAALARLTYTTDIEGFSQAGAVIEAIVERMDVKQQALRDFEPKLQDDALFATNTSALRVTELQSVARHPERVVGLHFFNPVPQMPLVEVIPGESTAEWATAAAARLAVAMGKYPIVVSDTPGFLVNRLLMPYLDSACRLLERGVPGEVIDRAAVEFGLPM